MSQLRQDRTTREWVIIATERATRPHDFALKRIREKLPAKDETCPFCPGNETKTPPATLTYPLAGEGATGWSLRVVPNRYPALQWGSDVSRTDECGLFRRMEGVGVHEVIIESPLHNICLALMETEQIANVIKAYCDRYRYLSQLPFLKAITIFRNHGETAGTSLRHPHSQLVATPVVPQHLRRRFEVASSYYDETGKCLYCDLTETELKDGSRVINETENLVVFHPHASQSPFETWVDTKEHSSCFGTLPESRLKELAGVLKATLLQLYEVLNDPDFNLIVYSAPTEEENLPYYDWHLRIIPRLTTVAGFELGAGMHINTALPEQTAEFMRSAASRVGV